MFKYFTYDIELITQILDYEKRQAICHLELNEIIIKYIIPIIVRYKAFLYRR